MIQTKRFKRRRLYTLVGEVRPHRTPKPPISGGRVGGGGYKPKRIDKPRSNLIYVPPLSFRQDNYLRVRQGLLDKKPPKTPPKYNTTIINDTDNNPNNNTTMFSKRKITKLKTRSSSSDALTSRSQSSAVNTNKKLADKLPSNRDASGITKGLGEDSRPVIPTMVTNKSRTLRLSSNDETRVIHKTVFTTGFNPSKSVRDAARLFGTAHQVLFDSKTEVRNLIERNTLTSGSGFNSKNVHVPNTKAQLSKFDVLQVLDAGWTNSVSQLLLADDYTQTFASIMKLKRQFMIHNSSTHFPIKFKISLAKLVQDQADDRSGTTLDNFMIPLSNATLTDTERSAIAAAITAGTPALNSLQPVATVPWIAQHGPGGVLIDNVNYLGRQYYEANFSLKSRGLQSSSAFNNGYEIIESFEKTIPPGDFWNFSHVHNCGGGIDIRRFMQEYNRPSSSAADPYSYVIMFEAMGTLCEGVLIQPGGRDTFLGTSPTFYTYEYKTSCYYVKENAVSNATINRADITSVRVHRREYLSSNQAQSITQSNTRQEVFVLNAQITADPNTTVNGEMYIPTTSGSAIRYDMTQSGKNAG